ncbi:permease [Hyphomicrobium denitrificans ATCC 51888]|uniref:Permease n=1 Tax=Hyphomicrobium denitrificans (strain ATCC 51888 / DSM 1869 / NCIMB 11706 / TK 0415) TaxID=582899 RepID=D8JWQ3_HYPDA|nr:hypothetical protein [Hyphomicrobium denitrificans]ADJ25011.1 permease [Hyphomicrobium denitrificans ATCC 51888]
MGPLFAILTAALSFAMSIPPAVEQYRRDRKGFWQTLRWMGVYALYIAVGIGVLMLSAEGPQPPTKAALATLFMLTWIAYGMVWLIRKVPRYRELPAWLDKRWLDHLFALALSCLLAAVFLV